MTKRQLAREEKMKQGQIDHRSSAIDKRSVVSEYVRDILIIEKLSF